MRIPGLPKRSGCGFEELARRHGDFAIIGVAAVLSLRANGAIASARLAYAGGGDRPTRAPRTEAALIGQQPTAETFTAAAQLASEEIDPPSDMHGTAGYRRKIAIVLTRRALAAARVGIQNPEARIEGNEERECRIMQAREHAIASFLLLDSGSWIPAPMFAGGN